MRDFQEFIDKNIAVTFADKKELRVFYELCLRNNAEGAGVIIENKEQALESYVYFSKIFETILVHFQNGLYDYKIVPASEFLQQQTTIEIFQSKQTVVCLKKQDNKVVAVGKAKCNPDDEFDFKIGSDLAYQRMNDDEWARNNPESKKYHDAGKLNLKGLASGIAAINAGLPAIQSALIAASEAEEKRAREKKMDELSGIKTLKNGMRIKKQDRYEVGDRVLVKKNVDCQLYGKMKDCLGEVCTIKSVHPDNNFILEESGNYYFSPCDIKGKVIQ